MLNFCSKKIYIKNLLYRVFINIFQCLIELRSMNVKPGLDISDQNLFPSVHQSSFYLPFTVGLLCRSFAKPPKQVQVVCECILVLRGYKEISWQSARGMMSEANFLRSLMEMDCDSITNNQVGTVKGKSASCSTEAYH